MEKKDREKNEKVLKRTNRQLQQGKIETVTVAGVRKGEEKRGTDSYNKEKQRM